MIVEGNGEGAEEEGGREVDVRHRRGDEVEFQGSKRCLRGSEEEVEVRRGDAVPGGKEEILQLEGGRCAEGDSEAAGNRQALQRWLGPQEIAKRLFVEFGEACEVDGREECGGGKEEREEAGQDLRRDGHEVDLDESASPQ